MRETKPPRRHPAMTTGSVAWQEEIVASGYTVLPGVFSAAQVEECLAALTEALKPSEAARSASGTVYAARNVLSLWPAADSFWRQPPLPEALCAVLGPHCGLVRTL